MRLQLDSGPGAGLVFIGGLSVLVFWLGWASGPDWVDWGFGACFGWLFHETAVLFFQWRNARRMRVVGGGS